MTMDNVQNKADLIRLYLFLLFCRNLPCFVQQFPRNAKRLKSAASICKSIFMSFRTAFLAAFVAGVDTPFGDATVDFFLCYHSLLLYA